MPRSGEKTIVNRTDSNSSSKKSYKGLKKKPTLVSNRANKVAVAGTDQRGLVADNLHISSNNAQPIRNNCEGLVREAYTARNDQELSLQTGELVSNLENRGNGWSGKCHGKVGLFPIKNINVISKFAVIPGDNGNDTQISEEPNSDDEIEPSERDSIISPLQSTMLRGSFGGKVFAFPDINGTKIRKHISPDENITSHDQAVLVTKEFNSNDADQLVLKPGDIVTDVRPVPLQLHTTE